MSLFKVGEIAIVTASKIPAFPVGCEVEILEVLDPSPWPGYQYIVYQKIDYVIFANDQCLRKKRPPPADGVGSWDEIEKLIGWNPNKEKIVIAKVDVNLEELVKFFEIDPSKYVPVPTPKACQGRQLRQCSIS